MLELEDVPPLRDPILVAAFEGWNDAGEAATATVAHLADVWDAEPVASLDPEDYYDFQVNRPRVVTEDGRRRVQWPTTRILLARRTGFDRDVVLVEGIEPSVRWRTFTIELLEYAQELGVDTVVILGALLADVPHTRPIPVTTTADDEQVRARYEAEASRYEGPTGIVGVLADVSTQAGLTCITCWAAVPHYAGGSPSPKATLSLLGKLEAVLNVTIPLGDLPESARAWERGVNELAESDEEVAEYVQSLEEQTDTADLPEASGDAIAREFERYLRRRGDDPPA
ncbi:PAC2 family protein [Lapillicoccus jejuensis]|uniref:Putative ATP-grasp superfamily ATP-dependent carboligase n=1 Tax=Lapillicoccus jejuensis TaxID=402171 RepID=A0A542E4M1_9MICO|nr:PAC2 family protein [Lapillicoccus jejuensis]TQJ10290.1 putative ATP-grasp superfamily ATP-dependent carboligase [Lapillicoccus jejuensis]